MEKPMSAEEMDSAHRYREDNGGMKVFIHLAHGQDLEIWARRWHNGELVGINNSSPYGFARASEMGCKLKFSKSVAEGFFSKLVRLGLRAILGFDYLQA